MQDAQALPEDLATCHAMLDAQATVLVEKEAVITEQSVRLDELSQQNSDYQREVEELNLALRKMLEGNRREKFTCSPDQLALEFADDPDLQEALQRARAEAEQITETITYQRKKRKQKKRSEKFPEHLRREFFDAPVSDDQLTCPTHGERKVIRYDEVETLVFTRPELFVRVTRYTGGLLLAHGFIEELYDHTGFRPAWKYQKVIEFLFENGVLVDEFDRSERMAEIREMIVEPRAGEEDRQMPTEDKIRVFVERAFDRKYRL